MSGRGRLVLSLALVWLVCIAPLDLAITTTRHLSRLFAGESPAFIALVLARVVSVALGMAVGVALWQRAAAARQLTRVWLATEAVTLVCIWFTSIIPTNRPPGLLLPVIGLYVAAGATVWFAAQGTRDASE